MDADRRKGGLGKAGEADCGEKKEMLLDLLYVLWVFFIWMLIKYAGLVEWVPGKSLFSDYAQKPEGKKHGY